MEVKPNCESCQKLLNASEGRRMLYLGDSASEATYFWFKETMKDCIDKNTCLPIIRLKTKVELRTGRRQR